MTTQSDADETYAATLQAAYHEVRLHSPQGVGDVEERLRAKLESHGVVLTDDILRALAFAIVNGRNL